MPPPPLRPSSAARMADVVAAADAAVDGGAHPDHALAKAARDHGLPLGHVPLVVRAFNTGRAVRQLDEADVWAKAAAYPVAAADKVLTILETPAPPPVKAAGVSDYARPPAGEEQPLRRPPPLSPAGYDRPKQASAPEEPAPVTPPRDNRLSSGFAAAAHYDRAARAVVSLTPAVYAGVKRAALAAAPDAAAYFFGRREAEDPDTWLLAKAAAAPDPRVTVDHPAVVALRELEAVKAAYVTPASGQHPGDGYEPFAVDGETTWYRPKAASVQTGPPLAHLFPVDPPAAEKPAAAKPALDLAAPTSSPPASVLGPTPLYAKSAGFGGGLVAPLRMTFGGAQSGNAMLKDVTHSLKSLSAPAGSADGLGDDLSRIDTQAAVQDLLTDPRFAGADPKLVVGTYHQLQGLAPRSMRNPALAADYIHRRLQTGPPSYFDLKALTDIEHNLTRIERANRGTPEEDD